MFSIDLESKYGIPGYDDADFAIINWLWNNVGFVLINLFLH